MATDEAEAAADRPPNQPIEVRFDAGGMGHWWGLYVGPVLVWSYSATEGPWDPGSREIIAALVTWGTTKVAPGSEPEFLRASAALRQPYDAHDFHVACGYTRVGHR